MPEVTDLNSNAADVARSREPIRRPARADHAARLRLLGLETLLSAVELGVFSVLGQGSAAGVSLRNDRTAPAQWPGLPRQPGRARDAGARRPQLLQHAGHGHVLDKAKGSYIGGVFEMFPTRGSTRSGPRSPRGCARGSRRMSQRPATACSRCCTRPGPAPPVPARDDRREHGRSDGDRGQVSVGPLSIVIDIGCAAGACR